MQAFESELRDSTEYYMWQTEMRDRDAAIRKEQVLHTRLDEEKALGTARNVRPDAGSWNWQESTDFCLLMPPTGTYRGWRA